jgi:hypothetical protein
MTDAYNVLNGVSSFQDENVKACLPLEYTPEDYSKKDVE